MEDGREIVDRDTLANYLFNEVSLNGIKGIGKKGKDNGILILYSVKPDSAGGSMRIEVGRGLEGNITDGSAGNILDSYLVPARVLYQNTGNRTLINEALLNTVLSLGEEIGYTTIDQKYQLYIATKSNDEFEIFLPLAFIVIIMIILIAIFARRKRWGGWAGWAGWTGGAGNWGSGSGWGGSSSSSSSSGFRGGGSSGGGGAGR
jgi:uncharacterized protein